MFVNYFWQQCIIGVRDALGHLAGLLCIKFREDILIINVARPVLLEFADRFTRHIELFLITTHPDPEYHYCDYQVRSEAQESCRHQSIK
jgi:hypothetical protein